MEVFSQSPSPSWIPFRIAPAFSRRPWGFPDLRPWYDMTVPSGEPIGEAWLTGDDCLAMSGPHKGRKLSALFAQAPQELLGTEAPRGASPLLIKVIFARQKLSVQVHPDDAMAQKYGEPRGKTECWYALSAEPGAQVACGLKPGVTLDEIRAGIAAGALESSLNALDVAAGDMIFVDAGTVHAIWPGAILLETQQNCDLTYRMYDYGRGRQLHIEESLEAAKLTTRAGKVAPRELAGRTILIEGDYFLVERLAAAGSRNSSSLPGEAQTGSGLQYLFAAAGAGRIIGAGFEPVELPLGGIVAVPAASPEFSVEDSRGLQLIRITPRWPGEKR